MNGKVHTKPINTIYSVLQISLIAAFIIRKEYLSVSGAIAVFVLYLLLFHYENKKGYKISDFSRILVLATILSNSFLGEYLRLYTTTNYFDKLLHIFGAFAFSMLTYSLSEQKGYFQYMTKSFTFIFILLSGTFLGTVFEIAEFICDLLLKTVSQSGLVDTNLDMIFNILGSAIAGIYAIYSKNTVYG